MECGALQSGMVGRRFRQNAYLKVKFESGYLYRYNRTL